MHAWLAQEIAHKRRDKPELEKLKKEYIDTEPVYDTGDGEQVWTARTQTHELAATMFAIPLLPQKTATVLFVLRLDLLGAVFRVSTHTFTAHLAARRCLWSSSSSPRRLVCWEK